jgi:putative ABC transport system permease protein
MKSVHGFGSSILVAALGAAFGAVMLIATQVLGDFLVATGAEGFETVAAVLNVIGFLFLAIALYVSAVVTANTCSTVIAGQTRVIALQRLIGASGSQLRRHFTRSGLVVGAMGAGIGTLAAVALSATVVTILRANGTLPAGSYSVVPPTVVVPIIAVVLTTWGAFAVGSRRVLAVRPIEALSSSVEPRREDVGGSRARSVIAVVLVGFGFGLLAVGVVLSGISPYMVLVAAFGGFVSFTGVAIGATLFVPPILALIGHVGSSNPAVLLSGRNALRAPGRASRATIGLVIGVTLLVTFSVALATYQQEIFADLDVPAKILREQQRTFATINTIAGSLSGFSGVIAAVGVVNVLALGVVQRRREVGLLRAIGFTGGQVRTMIVVEALQMVGTAIVLGLVLGTFYGWAGAVSLFRFSTHGAPIVPVLPLSTLVVVVIGGLLLAVVASLAPVRRVVTITPTEALAVD